MREKKLYAKERRKSEEIREKKERAGRGEGKRAHEKKYEKR